MGKWADRAVWSPEEIRDHFPPGQCVLRGLLRRAACWLGQGSWTRGEKGSLVTVLTERFVPVDGRGQQFMGRVGICRVGSGS